MTHHCCYRRQRRDRGNRHHSRRRTYNRSRSRGCRRRLCNVSTSFHPLYQRLQHCHRHPSLYNRRLRSRLPFMALCHYPTACSSALWSSMTTCSSATAYRSARIRCGPATCHTAPCSNTTACSPAICSSATTWQRPRQWRWQRRRWERQRQRCHRHLGRAQRRPVGASRLQFCR